MRERELIHACKRSDFKTVQDILVNLKRNNNKSIYKPTINDLQRKNQIMQVNHVDVNCREARFQMTPLMIASLQGSYDIVIYLIYYGASINLRDVKGNTALQLACMKQRFQIINVLLQNGANINDVNSSGWNCLISAVNYFHEDNSILLLILLQAGVKSEHKDNNGLMAIDHAVRKHKTNAIRVILTYNTKLAPLCLRALVNASIKGYYDIVLLLLNFGVNPDKIDIITGTGPQHEAVRFSMIKDEKIRDLRLKIVQYLALYGADPELQNTSNETPFRIASNKQPHQLVDAYMNALKAFYKQPHKKPKFINPAAKSLNDLIRIPKYQLLRPRLNWTRNDFRFCTQQKIPTTSNPVVNLIDGDPQTMWTVDSNLNVWIVFDFKADHTITKLRIYGWKSKEMPADSYLQASNSFEGPWVTIHQFKCQAIGSSNRNDPGVPQDFDGFNATARYWKIIFSNNYGSHQTSLHGVEFFGYDNRITKLIDQIHMNEYEDIFVENDMNQIEAIVNCTYEQFNRLPIYNENDKEKLWQFILELKARVSPLKKLEWLNEPTQHCLVGKTLPPFSVTSSAFLTDTLQLVCHGGAVISGDVYVDLDPGGMDEPSMAIFNNISFSNAGKFLLEIRSVADPNIHISATEPIIVYDHGDPNYATNAARDNNIPVRVVPRLKRFNSVDNQSDDDTDLKIDYDDNIDFSNRSSKMVINKWLSKSQDGYNGYNNDSYDSQTTSPDTITHTMYITSNGVQFNVGTNGNGNGNGGLNSYRDHHSPPLITNGNLPRIDERRSMHKYVNDQGMQTQQQQQQDQQIPRYEPNKFQPVVKKPIPNTARITQTETQRVIEYETQEFTVNFPEEPYQTLGRVNLKDRIDYLNSVPVTEPKSEARVFVTNNSYHGIHGSNGGGAGGGIPSEPFYNGVMESIYGNGFNNSYPKAQIPTNDYSTKLNVNGYTNGINGVSMKPMQVQSARVPAPDYESNNILRQIKTSRESIPPQSRLSQQQSQNPIQLNAIQKARESLIKVPKKPDMNSIEHSTPITEAKQQSNNVAAPQLTPPLPSMAIPAPPPPPPPPLPPSFFKRHSKIGADMVDSIKTINEELLSRNTDNSNSAQRFLKKQPTKPNNDAPQSPFQNSPKKRTRETPSPFTIDRIVDEAFDYISDPNMQNGYDFLNEQHQNHQKQQKSIPTREELDKINRETFTDKAKKRLEEYQKVKRNSLSNSSITSSINNTNRFTFSAFNNNTYGN